MAILPEHHPSPESDPLLHDDRDIAAPGSTCQTGEIEPRDEVSKELANRLYLSHFLSTWNSRVFEFGAVLYLATIYPGTLLPMSVYALSRGLAAIILASAVGHYVDVTNRLKVVRLSIGELNSHLAAHGFCLLTWVSPFQCYKDLPWPRLVLSSIF